MSIECAPSCLLKNTWMNEKTHFKQFEFQRIIAILWSKCWVGIGWSANRTVQKGQAQSLPDSGVLWVNKRAELWFWFYGCQSKYRWFFKPRCDANNAWDKLTLKNYLMFIWKSNLTGHLVLLFAKSSSPSYGSNLRGKSWLS